MKHMFVAFVCFGLLGCVTSGESLSGNWSFRDTQDQNLKSWGYKVALKADGHPVRAGENSLRFEVRSGDCSWSTASNSPSWYAHDCDNYKERREKKQYPAIEGGETWYHWSIYLPTDFPVLQSPTVTYLGQFHAKPERYAAPFMFAIDEKGVYKVVNNISRTGKSNLLSVDEMRGKWSDFLIHANWVKGKKGFFRVYVNGQSQPTYSSNGSTQRRGGSTYLKFGIYRDGIYKEVVKVQGPTPTQIVYYDDVRKGKTCSAVTEYFPCDKIMSGIQGP